MKHLDIKEGWIQLLRDRDIAEYWKIEGPLNLADFFTKLNDRIIFDQQYAMIQYIPTGEAALTCASSLLGRRKCVKLSVPVRPICLATIY